MSSAPARPVLRFQGGKFRLASWVISHFPPHRVYVEPFGGAASVLMRKPRTYAEVYNDLDDEIVSLFRVLRDPSSAARLEQSLRLTPYARTELLDAYVTTSDPVELARRTVVKSFMGFGSNSGMHRTQQGMRTRASTWKAPTGFCGNTTRSGTTPAHDWKHYPDAIVAMTERLQGVVIEHRPAIDVIRTHDREDVLHYVDPPYLPATRSAKRTGMYRHEMTVDDHRELAGVLHQVAGMVVLSGYPSDFYDKELYPDWHRVTRAALAEGARKRTEVLWLNRRAADAMSPTLFQVET